MNPAEAGIPGDGNIVTQTGISGSLHPVLTGAILNTPA